MDRRTFIDKAAGALLATEFPANGHQYLGRLEILGKLKAL